MILLLLLAQLGLADRLYDARYYGEAEVEYRRALFYHCSDTLKSHCLERLSLCLHHGGKPEPAIAVAKELVEYDAAKREAGTLMLTRLYILHGFYALARLEVENLVTTTSRDSIKTQARRLSGITNVFREKYEAAAARFLEAGDTARARNIDSFAHRSGKSVFKAVLFSSVIPGTGALYAGNYRLAAIDVAMNAGTAFLLYNAIRKKKTFDAVLIVSLLSARFYTGARSNAANSARDYNERKRRAWLASLAPSFASDLKLE